MALGVVVMLVFGRVADGPRRPGARAVGLPSSRCCSSSTSSSSGAMSPRVTRAQQLRAEVSEVAHESFEARWSSRRWAARTRRPSGSARSPTSCATPTSRSAAPAACSTRPSRPCPPSARSPCSSSAPGGSSSGATDAAEVVQVAYLFSLPRVPGARAGLGARRAAARGRRLGPGDARPRRDAADGLRRPRSARTGARAARAGGRRATPTADSGGERRPVLARTSTLDVAPGRPSPWSAPPAAASRR